MEEKSVSGESSWEQLIDSIIKQIEVVSQYFGYTEEYVLDHTLPWISRKFKQAQSEMYEEHKQKVFAGFQSLMLLVDAAFNKGKDFEKIVPPSLDNLQKMNEQKQIAQDFFVSGAWWK